MEDEEELTPIEESFEEKRKLILYLLKLFCQQIHDDWLDYQDGHKRSRSIVRISITLGFIALGISFPLMPNFGPSLIKAAKSIWDLGNVTGWAVGALTGLTMGKIGSYVSKLCYQGYTWCRYGRHSKYNFTNEDFVITQKDLDNPLEAYLLKTINLSPSADAIDQAAASSSSSSAGDVASATPPNTAELRKKVDAIYELLFRHWQICKKAGKRLETPSYNKAGIKYLVKMFRNGYVDPVDKHLENSSTDQKLLKQLKARLEIRQQKINAEKENLNLHKQLAERRKQLADAHGVELGAGLPSIDPELGHAGPAAGAGAGAGETITEETQANRDAHHAGNIQSSNLNLLKLAIAREQQSLKFGQQAQKLGEGFQLGM